MRGRNTVVATLALLLLGSLARAEGPAKPAAPAAPAPSAAAARGQALYDAGKYAEAETALREALAANPADGEARLVLGHVLDGDGRADEAQKAWEEGLAGKDADVPLLRALANLHERRAADGPMVTRRRGSKSIRMSAEKVDEAAFRKTHLDAALAALRKAAALRPADDAVAFSLACLLNNLTLLDEAVKVWEGLGKRDGKNPRVLVGWARALQALGKKDDARRKIDQALKAAPRSAEAHEALSQSLKEAGKGPEAEGEHRRAQLLSWLAPFSKLEYSDALFDKVAALAPDPFWSAKDEAEAKRMWDAKRAIVDALVAAKDEPSYDLLACICWAHCCHGPIEDAAFAALEARGKPSIPALLEILRRGNACGVGAAAKALARMREAAAFEDVVRRLPRDTDPFFPLDIAGALVLFGDPRAVPALVAAMEIDAPPTPKAKPAGRGRTVVVGADGAIADGHDGMPDGRSGARGRACLAVGEFDVPEARAALERGCANPEIGGYCHAVLWRLTKDEKAHGKAVAAAMNGEGIAPSLLGPYLLRIDHPNAKMLHAAWVKEREPKKK